MIDREDRQMKIKTQTYHKHYRCSWGQRRDECTKSLSQLYSAAGILTQCTQLWHHQQYFVTRYCPASSVQVFSNQVHTSVSSVCLSWLLHHHQSQTQLPYVYIVASNSHIRHNAQGDISETHIFDTIFTIHV